MSVGLVKVNEIVSQNGVNSRYVIRLFKEMTSIEIIKKNFQSSAKN